MATMNLTAARTERAEAADHTVVLTHRPWAGWTVHTIHRATGTIGDARPFHDDETAARRYANQLHRTR